MARFAALSTSDPALVRCELSRVKDRVELDEKGWVFGVGAYQEDVIIHRRFGVEMRRTDAWALPDTEAVVLHAGELPVGQQLDEAGQPFRFRRWLFAQVAEVDRPARVRERLFEELPGYLQTWVRGSSLGEVIFGVFLAELRAIGRTDDPSLEAPSIANLLLKTARRVEHVSAEVGGTQRSRQALVASNGRVLAAARLGEQPLAWSLLEGQATCERCQLTGAKGEPEALVRDHLRRRTVVVATHPRDVQGWVAVPDGGGLAVDRHLGVHHVG